MYPQIIKKKKNEDDAERERDLQLSLFFEKHEKPASVGHGASDTII